MARLLLIATGTLGDVLPMFAVAERLRDRGHTVWVIAPETYQSHLKDSIRYQPLGGNEPEKVQAGYVKAAPGSHVGKAARTSSDCFARRHASRGRDPSIDRGRALVPIGGRVGHVPLGRSFGPPPWPPMGHVPRGPHDPVAGARTPRRTSVVALASETGLRQPGHARPVGEVYCAGDRAVGFQVPKGRPRGGAGVERGAGTALRFAAQGRRGEPTPFSRQRRVASALAAHRLRAAR